MPGVDPQRTFVPVSIAILTVSDSRTFENDTSGATLAERAKAAGHTVAARKILTDDLPALVAQLTEWIEDAQIDVILTTGGTGLTGRDVTTEAMERVVEKTIPGFGELFRWLSYQKIGTSTIQSRAMGGVAQGTFLFALPGSTNACKDAWDDILVQQFDARYRPCNFVEIMPRLQEHNGTHNG